MNDAKKYVIGQELLAIVTVLVFLSIAGLLGVDLPQRDTLIACTLFLVGIPVWAWCRVQRW